MPARAVRRLLLFLLVLIFARQVLAITSFPQDIECPVCKTKNSFQVYASWGSYIYQWPSKFQLVFWPFTYSESLYSCKKCHLTAFLDDFTKLPREKVEAAQAALRDVRLKKEYEKYTDIPMSERLPIAEKVYHVLDKDDEFWCHFYRVEGYHFDRESKAPEAAAARGKALELAQKIAADPKNAGRLKELLYVSASMKHFLGRDAEALADLDSAAKLTFSDTSWKEENAKGYDNYLSGLIKECAAGIKNGNLPKGSDE
jgi:hypothetical protein